MPRTLQINVQIDRLPDIGPRMYVGVRTSAWIVADAADRAAATDRKLVTPWNWTPANAPPDQPWNCSATGWAAWWIDGPTVTPATVTPCIRPDLSNPRAALPAAWQTARDALLQQLAESPQALEGPGMAAGAQAPASVTAQTVFGFVENLSTFPAPWPEGHQVWTCLRVDTAAPTQVAELVIVPVFGVDDGMNGMDGIAGAYTVTPPPRMQGTSADHVWCVDYVATPRADKALLAASAVVDRLRSAASLGARILLEEKFLIGGAKSPWAGPSSRDEIIRLPGVISEILDPFRGLAQALEQVLHLEPAAMNNKETPLAVARLLRIMLATVCWRMLSKTATGTNAFTPLPIGPARKRLTPEIRNLLAAMTLRSAIPPDPDGTVAGLNPLENFQVWSDARIGALFGLSPDDLPSAWPGPYADTEDGLRDFVAMHWFFSGLAAQEWDSALTLTASNSDLMRMITLQWDATAGKLVEDAKQLIGLFDLSEWNAPPGDGVGIALRLKADASGNKLMAEIVAENGTTLASVETASIDDKEYSLRLVVKPSGNAPRFVVFLDDSAVDTGIADTAALNGRAFLRLRISSGAARLRLAAANVSAQLARVTLDDLLNATSATVLRENFALASTAPILPFIIGGLDPAGQPVATGGDMSPLAAIAAATTVWAARRFADECAVAVGRAASLLAQVGAKQADLDYAQRRFERSRDLAIENAKLRSEKLAIAVAPDIAAYAVSPKADPIAFPVDQPQPFEDGTDLWLAFAGIGVLAGVSTTASAWPDNDKWYSLNCASMHLPGVDTSGARNDLTPENVVCPGCDPVPLQVADIGGVRAASIVYENRSLVGEMPHDPGHASTRNPGAPSRRSLQGYAFPRAGAKLPALCYGKRFFFLPYMIGHGGALPNILHSTGESVTQLAQKQNDGCIGLTQNTLTTYLGGAGGYDDIVRTVDYRRSTPVSTPRLDNAKSIPGIPDGVAPLAAEIGIRAAPLTLGVGERAYFYRSSDVTEGTLELGPQEGDPKTSIDRRALQIDIGGAGTSGPRPGFELAVIGTNGELLSVSIARADWPQDGTLGLRIVVSAYGVRLFVERRVDSSPERPTQFVVSRSLGPATDISAWRALSIVLRNPESDLTILPPVASSGVIQGDQLGLKQAIEFAQSERAHRKRQISVLDGMFGSKPSFDVHLRRPAVDFATYERWINWDLTDERVRDALDKAHDRVVVNAAPAGMDLTCDDPAVEGLVVELVSIFPATQSFGRKLLRAAWSTTDEAINSLSSNVQSLTVIVDSATALDPDGLKVRIAPGTICELRIHGAIREQQAFGKNLPKCADRFAKGVWEGMLKFTSDQGAGYRLGAPLVLTFEVATDAMPLKPSVPPVPRPDAPLQIMREIVATNQDRARVCFATDFAANNYSLLRYVNRVELISQRWSWRGHQLEPIPQGMSRIGDDGVQLNGSDGLFDDVRDFERFAFIDRADDDVGVIEQTALKLANVLPGDNQQLLPLFRKDLKYHGGANWWRFAIRATSRYAAMRPNRDFSTTTSPNWHTLVVRDRDTGRSVKRPGLMLVLPLTEAISQAPTDTVPPLLALFSEPMCANAHIGDGIEVAVDFARYPLKDHRRFWPQAGPDPVLTGIGQTERPQVGSQEDWMPAQVAMRLDGPIGFTFDIDAPAPLLGRSGYLVSPVASKKAIPPWGFARLRFRRSESVELSTYAVATGSRFLLDSDAENVGSGDVPVERHEGLVIDFDELGQNQPVVSTVSISGGSNRNSVEMRAEVSPTKVTLTTTVKLDNSKSDTVFEVDLEPSSRSWARLVLSQRDRPQQGQELYEPTMDVAVRLLVDDGADAAPRSETATWLTVACVPVPAGAKTFKPTDPVYVDVSSSTGSRSSVRGIRLSPFCAPQWCQFTQDVSKFMVTVADTSSAACGIDSIAATVGANLVPQLEYVDANGGRSPIRSIHWLESDNNAQVGAVVTAVLTAIVRDASDKPREMPVAVYRVDDGIPFASMHAMWTNPGGSSDFSKFRIRLMSVMYPRVAPSDQPPDSLAACLPDEFGDSLKMDAPDAAARIVGVSKPIDVG